MTEELSIGKTLTQQTRGWNAEKGVTEFQRTKESAEDYRYFKEPDIPIIKIDTTDIERITEELGELPDEKVERYIEEYKLSEYDANVLTATRENANFFEEIIEKVDERIKNTQLSAKISSNWVTGVIFAILNATSQQIGSIKWDLDTLAEIIADAENKKVNLGKAKEIVTEAIKHGTPLSDAYKKSEITVIQDENLLESIVSSVLNANPKAVEDYKSGKQNAIGFLIGQAMRESKGNGDPNTIKELILKKLNQ